MNAQLHKGAKPPTTPGIVPRWVIGPGRQAGKYLVNPLILRTAAGRLGPTAIVRHVGRRSGRTYATPVYAGRLGDDFMIALLVGTEADWCRNVWAAGRCTLRLRGVSYALTGPELVDQATALRAFPVPIRVVGRLFGFRHFLKLRLVGMP
ncbi:MAG: nitroreductase family deazaflavin-dependent oxidoreductase [Candidatus Limnocylindria bacterium]